MGGLSQVHGSKVAAAEVRSMGGICELRGFSAELPLRLAFTHCLAAHSANRFATGRPMTR